MNAELLIMFMLGCDRAYLYAHPERELSLDEIRRYDEAIARRSTGVPAQYITGHQEFWGLDLIVSPDVLIPRPETEHIVETVLELVKNNGRSPSAPLRAGSAPSPHKLRIVDLGTGSGAIALALAKELPSAEIHASDISAKALEVARANAARHELTSRIEFHQADLLDGSRRPLSTSWFPTLPTSASRRGFRADRSPKVRAAQRGLRGTHRPGGHRAAGSRRRAKRSLRRMAGIRNQRYDCRSSAALALGLEPGRV